MPDRVLWYPVFVCGPSVPRSQVFLERLVTHSTELPETKDGTARTGVGCYQGGPCQASCNVYNNTYCMLL